MSASGYSFAVLALAAVLSAVPARADDVEQTIIELEKAWSAAFLAHDTAAIARILADDFVGIDGRGVMSTKAQELEEAKASDPESQLLGETLDEFKARSYGNTALLTARNTARFRVKGEERTIRYRRTTIWVKRDGRWQCVHFHGSRILEPVPASSVPM
jgi:ketosteroid isomerase-like protein